MKKLILMLLLAFSTIITVHAQSKKDLNELNMYFNRPDEEVDTSYYPPVGQGTILLQEFKERQKELDEYQRELLKRIREKLDTNIIKTIKVIGYMVEQWKTIKS